MALSASEIEQPTSMLSILTADDMSMELQIGLDPKRYNTRKLLLNAFAFRFLLRIYIFLYASHSDD